MIAAKTMGANVMSPGRRSVIAACGGPKKQTFGVIEQIPGLEHKPRPDKNGKLRKVIIRGTIYENEGASRRP
jgi:hypothetical protein